eukprot:296769_1
MEQRSQNSLLLSHFCILLLSIYVVAKQKFALSKVHKSTQRASVLSPKTRPLQSPNADGFIADIKSVVVDVWAEEGKEGIHVYGALKVRYPEKWQTCAENGCPRWTQGCLVVVIWSANTERFCEVTPAVHDSEENLMKAIVEGHPEVAPSQMFAMASLLEGYSYINGSPQNTFVPAIIATAERLRLFVAGDDFKSGQTKIKSVLVDFLLSAAMEYLMKRLGDTRRKRTLRILDRLATNVLANPADTRYTTLKTIDPEFRAKVTDPIGGLIFLRLMGVEQSEDGL